MNRIDQTFRRLRKEGRKAFIPYVTAGDPDMKTSERIVLALAKSGADIIEIGIPFSDPLADGPTIQRAVARSLSAGCTTKKVLNMVRTFRKKIDTPLVFMTYFNIVLNYGIGRFIASSVKAGADGLIVPDLPMEEAGDLAKKAAKKDFDLVLLSAPTTPPARFKKIAVLSRGFVYHVSLTGVTGVKKALVRQLSKDVAKFKKLTAKPVCVGFGVSKPSQAKRIASLADGVIVGSALIKIIEKNLGNVAKAVRGVASFAKAMAKAIH